MSSDFVSIIDDFIQRVCKIELLFFSLSSHRLVFFVFDCLHYLVVDKFPGRMFIQKKSNIIA